MIPLLLRLWGRLVCFTGLPALLAVIFQVLLGVDGWLMYQTAGEVVADVGARLLMMFAFSGVLGTLVFVFALPFLLLRPKELSLRAERLTRAAFTIMVLAGISGIFGMLLRWAMGFVRFQFTNHAYILLWTGFSALLVITFAIGSAIFPVRFTASPKLVQSASNRAARRLIVIAGLGGVVAAFANKVPSALSASRLRKVNASSTPGKNVILVTFDALSMEDVSFGGYRLPTTPNIDALAEKSYGFTNFYSASTFTTPAVVSTMTGRYPSNTHVYQYGGRLRGKAADQTLPAVLRANGYTTAASVANPGAHPACLGFGAAFDRLPALPIKDFAVREATALFNSAALANDAGFVGRTVPYLAENLSSKLFGQVHSGTPPKMSFDQAEKLLGQLHDPFFLWVHVYAPHFPYLPEPPFLKMFLPSDELRTHAEFADMFDLKGYHFSAAKKQVVARARLRYDEWVATADGAFGQFMSTLQRTGHGMNTAIVVAADHGESFGGGYVGHGGSSQLRSIIHIPLVVHMPGMTKGYRISSVADQTCVAPTILEIAGIKRPLWMDGESLCGPMRGDTSPRPAHAFTQYFETNSAFKPIHSGSVGVIDGRHQYVFDVGSKSGSLYDLKEANEQKNELSASEPQVAAELQDVLRRRFPDVLGT